MVAAGNKRSSGLQSYVFEWGIAKVNKLRESGGELWTACAPQSYRFYGFADEGDSRPCRLAGANNQSKQHTQSGSRHWLGHERCCGSVGRCGMHATVSTVHSGPRPISTTFSGVQRPALLSACGEAVQYTQGYRGSGMACMELGHRRCHANRRRTARPPRGSAGGQAVQAAGVREGRVFPAASRQREA